MHEQVHSYIADIYAYIYTDIHPCIHNTYWRQLNVLLKIKNIKHVFWLRHGSRDRSQPDNMNVLSDNTSSFKCMRNSTQDLLSHLYCDPEMLVFVSHNWCNFVCDHSCMKIWILSHQLQHSCKRGIQIAGHYCMLLRNKCFDKWKAFFYTTGMWMDITMDRLW